VPVAAFLVVLLVAVGVVVLLMRAAAASGGGGAGASAARPPRMRPRRPGRPVAPDDDPDFLRELDRRRSTGEGPAV
jgi:hypothetical protein